MRSSCSTGAATYCSEGGTPGASAAPYNALEASATSVAPTDSVCVCAMNFDAYLTQWLSFVLHFDAFELVEKGVRTAAWPAHDDLSSFRLIL